MKASPSRSLVALLSLGLPSLATLTPLVQATPVFETVQAFVLGSQQPTCQLVQDADGNFYGTSRGGANGYGTVFKASPDGTVTTLVHFNQTNGAIAYGSLVAGADGSFYGLTVEGGASNAGTIFKVTAAGVHTILHHFTGGADGAWPIDSLILANDGHFYGSTVMGGANGRGTAFKMSPTGEVTVINNWDNAANGWAPSSALSQGADGNFYGTTRHSDIPGHDDSGTIFRMTPAGIVSIVATLGDLPNMDFNAPNSVIQASDGNLYGTTVGGGAGHCGTVYKVTPTGTITLLAEFAWNENANPMGKLVQTADGNLYGTSRYGGTYGHSSIFKISPSGEVSTIANLGGPPESPTDSQAGLIVGTDGNLYGTSSMGGQFGLGTVFRATPEGEITVVANLYGYPEHAPQTKLAEGPDGSFYGTTGRGGFGSGSPFKLTPDGEIVNFAAPTSQSWGTVSLPHGGLVMGNDGTFYGTSAGGGDYGQGGVYQLTPAGELTNVASFTGIGGYDPTGVIQGSDGNFYGTTTSDSPTFSGTIFKMTPTGNLTTLAEFDATVEPNLYCPNGGLIEASDGNFYGTTASGGASATGGVFKVSPTGTLTTLAEFGSISEGAFPEGGLVEGSDGNFYGMTTRGGPGEAGTVFRMAPDGTLTTIAAFSFETTGGYPSGALVQGPDGAFYGVNQYGNATANQGAVFRVTSSGDLSTVFQFDGVHGSFPFAGLTLATDGSLYGVTREGGTTSDGKPGGGGQIFRIRFGAEVTTEAATTIASASATLNGTVNPGGYETTAVFQYGTSPTLDTYSTASAGTIPAGTAPVTVVAPVAGLTPGTTYYFRLVANNAETPVTQKGEILSLTTAIASSAHIAVQGPSGQVLVNGGSLIPFSWTTVGHPVTVNITLRNTSAAAPLTGISASFTGADAGQFSVVTAPPATLAPGATATFTVRLNPTSAGIKRATLSIASSDADANPFTVRMAGASLTPAQARLALFIRWILGQL